MNRVRGIHFVLLLLISVVAGRAATAGGSEVEFKTAFDAAQAAEKEAGALKNRWTTTEQTLAAASKAAAAGDFDGGVKLARQAEALARASIAQAQEQKTAWKSAVIH